MLYNMRSPTQKYRVVSEGLRHAIRTGEYCAGCRLPSERELAERFNVSHMTARRAVNELVEDNLLERRPPVGTFVRLHPVQRLRTRQINLLCTADDNPLARQFIQAGLSQIEGLGAVPRLIRYSEGHESVALRALRSSEKSLVLLDNEKEESPIREALAEARERVVVIGNRMDEFGVPSVMTDDAASTRLAIQRLREAGHRKIGILCDNPDYYIDRVRLQTWHENMKSEFEDIQLNAWTVCAYTPRFGNLGKHVFDALHHCLCTGGAEMTALISTGITMTIAALSACHAVGRAVPHKFSIVNSVDNPLLEFTHPPVTCVDNRLDHQISLALELLENHERTQANHSLFYPVAPQLIERSSVGPIELNASFSEARTPSLEAVS